MTDTLPPAIARLLVASTSDQRRDGSVRYRLSNGSQLVGGPPGDGSLAEEWAAIAPSPPPPIRAVWSRHDGLGRPGDARTPVLPPCLHPSSACRPLSAVVRFGENDILFAPSDWLWVATIGDVAWCCHRDLPGVAPFRRATHELQPTRPLDTLWAALAAAWAEEPARQA